MENQQNILVVDDEETICEVLKLNLEIAGFNVDVANSAEEALALNMECYSLILLDVMMGKMSGFELAGIIRSTERLKDIPIIICTAKDSEDDLVEGFSRGVDDYIKKPFSMRELVLRVKSVLRRAAGKGEASTLKYKTLTLDVVGKSCSMGCKRIPLTKKEFEILHLFLSYPGRIFSREEILNRVWDDDVLVIDRTIDVNINRLRRKLGEYGNNIMTKLGYGYGFQQ
jgi:two-component system alkaline phosphatase synthesis response regulator PhoP